MRGAPGDGFSILKKTVPSLLTRNMLKKDSETPDSDRSVYLPSPF